MRPRPLERCRPPNATRAPVPRATAGSAVVFFPAFVDGRIDKRYLHEACPAADTKYVCQVWIRQADIDDADAKPVGLGHKLLSALREPVARR
eukprot:1530153-Prymnesium_polylepis.1